VLYIKNINTCQHAFITGKENVTTTTIIRNKCYKFVVVETMFFIYTHTNMINVVKLNKTEREVCGIHTVSCSPAVGVIVLPSGVGALGSDGGATIVNSDKLTHK